MTVIEEYFYRRVPVLLDGIKQSLEQYYANLDRMNTTLDKLVNLLEEDDSDTSTAEG